MNIVLLVSGLALTLIKQSVWALILEECPGIFLRFCANHSYCLPPNASCNILAYYPTIPEINLIVNMHNAYRDVVASGQEGLPPASNMMHMSWDPELAAVAQKYADQCLYEHDKTNCRRVMNFAVGQNIVIQTLTGGHTVPEPNWEFVIRDWFKEIIYFPQNEISDFQRPQQHEYRHFSQLIWARTFRVGCGYVLFKTGKIFEDVTYTRLYICNYGPAGNVYGSFVYKQGNPCSDCPLNTCCGNACDFQANYKNLCYRSNSKPPVYPPPPNLFYCAFQNQTDCDNYFEGDGNWVVEPTLDGNYLGIVLDGGGNSTFVFKKLIKPTSNTFCVSLLYRKGPERDGEEQANTALQIFYIPDLDYSISEPLKSYEDPVRHRFSSFNVTAEFNRDTQIKISFAVPPGKPAQFLNVRSIIAVDGPCQNN